MFTPTLAGGGVERNVVRIALELQSRGFSVDVVVAQAMGELVRDLPADVRLVDLGVPLGSGGLTLAVLPLSRYLRQHRPEILWSNMTQANIVSLLALGASGNRRTWCIVSEHSVASARIKSPMKRFLLAWLARHVYPRADRVHAVSLAVARETERFANLPRGSVTTIHNPVVDARLFRMAEEPVQHRWFDENSVPVLVSVGRLVREKDLGTLLRAVALINQDRNGRTRLLIVGDGPERTRLQTLTRELGLEDCVEFTGYVSNPFPYVKRATVFVLSSRSEGFGNVLVEAMALGIPVVATDGGGGPREILEGAKWGELVSVGDAVGLADAICRVLNGLDSSRILGAIERAHAFEVTTVVDMYVERLFPPKVE